MDASVLIVDDHSRFRHFARRLLEESGFRIVGEAADAAAALVASRALRPDVVLLDVVLPDRSGLEVARELAGYDPRPTVVLTSSRTVADLGAVLDDLPVAGFVPKSELTPGALEALLVA